MTHNGRALRVTEIALRRDQPQETAKMLTPEPARFVEEYLVDLNGKQAAIRPGTPRRRPKCRHHGC